MQTMPNAPRKDRAVNYARQRPTATAAEEAVENLKKHIPLNQLMLACGLVSISRPDLCGCTYGSKIRSPAL
jgi:hypothetical protein